MFQFKYFHIPRTLSRDYCKRVLSALEKVVPSTSSGLKKKPQIGIIHLIVIASDEMAKMNKQFRGKEGPTDILTFPFIEGETRKQKTENRKEVCVGEIYLCLEKIKLYAKERGVTYKEQLEYIIVHGLVHLMGYDHETDAESEEMEKMEKRIISLLS